MKVIAREGLKIPKAPAPVEYITDEKPVDVQGCTYYRNLIVNGDLIVLEEDVVGNPAPVEDTAPAEDNTPAPKKTKKGGK